MKDIGLLILMHDKLSTLRDWQNALGDSVRLHPFYPLSHRPKHPGVMQPLELEVATQLDAFIITGAPVDRLDFNDVWYYPEVTQLIDALQAAQVPQLYSCWSAMAALHHEFGLDKTILPQKLFGVYPHHILKSSPLLQNLPANFSAPHARFADMDVPAMQAAVDVIASTTNGHPFLAVSGRQTFLFSHLEYQRFGLWEEYQRAGGPQAFNDDPLHRWPWESVRERFFHQWRRQINADTLTLSR